MKKKTKQKPKKKTKKRKFDRMKDDPRTLVARLSR